MLLAELTDAHLLTRPAPDRYSLHDLLGSFACELAHTSDPASERRAAMHRVLDYYLYSADAAGHLLDQRTPVDLDPVQPGVAVPEFAGRDDAERWFTAERRAILAAVEWAASAGFDDHVWRLGRVLRMYLHRQAMWSAQVTVQRLAAEAARRQQRPAAEGVALACVAVTSDLLGRPDDAQVARARALRLLEATDDRAGQAQIHLGVAHAQFNEGRVDVALRSAHRALALYQLADQPVGQASALNSIGWAHIQNGDYERAVAHLQQALHVLLRDPDPNAAGHIWDSLGYAYHRLGRHDRSVPCYRLALQLLRAVGDRVAEADTLTRLGDTHQAAGQPELANQAWSEALAARPGNGTRTARDETLSFT
jgi:tetratricopeptide (TPR) repeat protein